MSIYDARERAVILELTKYNLTLQRIIQLNINDGINLHQTSQLNHVDFFERACAYIIIIVIIITHTKIGAQQKKKYINDYMDQ